MSRTLVATSDATRVAPTRAIGAQAAASSATSAAAAAARIVGLGHRPDR